MRDDLGLFFGLIFLITGAVLLYNARQIVTRANLRQS